MERQQVVIFHESMVPTLIKQTPNQNPTELKQREEEVTKFINGNLNAKHRIAFILRYDDAYQWTLEEIGQVLNVTKERVRQYLEVCHRQLRRKR